MKNNIKLYSLFAIFTGLGLVSCSTDFIEEKRDLSAVTNEVYEYEELSLMYLDELYSSILPTNNSNMAMWSRSADDHADANEFALTSDEFAGESDFNQEYAVVDATQAHALKTIGNPSSTSYRNEPYQRIRKVNVYLDQVDNFSGLEEDFKDQIKGQLIFWRAWQYFELVKLYGGIPVVLTAQDPVIVEGVNAELQVPRSSSSETFEQIVADLDMAYTLLEQGRDFTPEDYGRITKEAVLAFKGRVLLRWASPQFNRSDDVSRWQRAYDANLEAKNAADAAGKGLHPNWNQMFLEGDENMNMEAIIVYNFNSASAGGDYAKNNATERYSRPADLGANGNNSPTKQIVDAFFMSDGTPYIPDANGDGDYDDFYKNRDPRFYYTFAYNGARWAYEEDPEYRVWTYFWSESTPGELDMSTENNPNDSGIYLRKFASPETSELDGFRYVPTSYIDLRYTEILMNLAEAAVGIGKLEEAKGYVRQIRERAGIEAGAEDYGLASFISRDEHFEMIINERKVEFAYENKRFNDLRRWLLFDDTYGTVSRLNQTPIDGMRRQGYYTVAMNNDGTEYVGAEDPFLGENAPVIERNPETYPEGISTYDEYLDYLYENHFKVIVRDDLEEEDDWTFTWFDEYYFFGLPENILREARYLEQNQGWGGSFDPLQ